MARERISDDYEDFEPEVRIWPYVVLAFLLQVFPFSLTILVGDGLSLSLVLRALYGLLPLFFTASILRQGEKPWKLVVAGLVYVIVELTLWTLSSVKGATGYALGIPFGLVLSPLVLSLSAYVFFMKRRHGKWLGTVLVSYLVEGVVFFMLTRYAEGRIWLVYPSLLVALTTLNLFVTRRTDGTPWFIAVNLGLLTMSSALFSPKMIQFLSGSIYGAEAVEAILGILAYNQCFWYTLSFLFVFSGLASKSSYRRIYEDDDVALQGRGDAGRYDEDNSPSDDREDIPQRPSYVNLEEDMSSRYSYPPEYNRPQEDVEQERREPDRKVETPKSPSYEDQHRSSSSSSNDKWYEFIRGGVKESESDRREDTSSYKDRDRRDDRYYEDRDRRPYEDRRERDYQRDSRRESRYDDREREAYRRNLYDDRQEERYDDRYYDDRRRDDRYYDDRRDDRYYRDRDRRGYDDRRDYEDRRDYPRDSRRYDDDYDQRSRRYDEDRDRS